MLDESESRRPKVDGVASDISGRGGGDSFGMAAREVASDDGSSDRASRSHVSRPPPTPLHWRVFINHIDSYHAGKLTDLLLERSYIPPEFDTKPSTSAAHSEKQEDEDEDEDEVDDDDGDEAAAEKEEYRAAGESTKPRRRLESRPSEPPRKFQLIATALASNANNEYYSCDNVKIIPTPEENREKFMAEILKCGFIVYDITQDKSQIAEASWVLNEVARIVEAQQSSNGRCFKATAASHETARHFILISSIMTWARTTPRPQQQPFTEADFKKRRAPASFKEQLECERSATRRRPNLPDGSLRTLVLCAGVTYGEAEADLHYAFKLAWSNCESLPVVGAGENLVPLLHVCDLAAAVYAVIRKWPKLRYIVAVDKEATSQKILVKAISKSLSSGKVKSIPAQEALTYPDVTQRVLEAITVDLDIRPAYLLKSNTFMEWHSELGFCANVASLVAEYRAARKLNPVRLIVLGPPASGKTMIARALARHYRLHYVSLKRLIADTIQQLSDQIEDFKELKEDVNKENEELEDDGNSQEANSAEDIENLEYMLNEIRNDLDENNGRLNENLLTKIFRRKLESKECQNQGYVIDGYPKTLEQARSLFGEADNPTGPDREDYEEDTAADAEEDENKEDLGAVMPDLVIVLDASDDFLMERVINLPERDLLNTHYTEEHMLERLRLYRERNEEDNTPLQLFDELEIHPIVVDIERDESPQMLSTFRYCLSVIGPPRNYGASPEEMEEERRRAEENSVLAAAERERDNAEWRRERERRASKWTELLGQLKQEEEERLCVMAEPLRHYLVKHVFPTLTQGLIEVAKLRPDEPIDYLAEYLFKENPEGRAQEPDYSEAMSETLGAIRRLQADGVLPSVAVSVEAYEHSKTADKFSRDTAAECRCSDEDRSIARIPGEVVRSQSESDEEDEEEGHDSSAYTSDSTSADK